MAWTMHSTHSSAVGELTRRRFLSVIGGAIAGSSAIKARVDTIRPSGESTALEPFVTLAGVHYRTIVSQGIRLVVGEAGLPSAPSVVLVHGGLIEHSWWRAQVAPLVNVGLRVVLPNMPGHGGSDPQPLHDLSDPYDVNSQAIADIIDQLALHRPLVVGWSAGGLTLGQGLGPAGVLEKRVGAAMFTGTFARNASTSIDSGLYPSIALALTGLPAAFVGKCLNPAQGAVSTQVRRQLETGTHPHPSAPPRILRATLELDNAERLRSTRVPVTVVHGRDDEAARPMGGRDLAELAGVDFIELAHGHATFLTDPGPFNDHVMTAASECP